MRLITLPPPASNPEMAYGPCLMVGHHCVISPWRVFNEKLRLIPCFGGAWNRAARVSRDRDGAVWATRVWGADFTWLSATFGITVSRTRKLEVRP